MNKIFEAELLFAFLCHQIYWLNFCVRVQPLPGALLSTRPFYSLYGRRLSRIVPNGINYVL